MYEIRKSKSGKELNKERKEAISHIVTSTDYWKGDTIDNSYFLNNLGIERAFEEAVDHVKYYHYPLLTEHEIEEAKKLLKISK